MFFGLYFRKSWEASGNFTYIAIEHDHRNSGFTQLENGGSFHSYVNVDQRVAIAATPSSGIWPIEVRPFRAHPGASRGEGRQTQRAAPSGVDFHSQILGFESFIELDDGKIYRKDLYLMVKTMVSCRFSLKPIHWKLGISVGCRDSFSQNLAKGGLAFLYTILDIYNQSTDPCCLKWPI